LREAVKILTRLSKLFEERCHVTHKRFTKRGFTLHHLWYRDDDVEYKDFPQTPNGRDQYYAALEPNIRGGITESERKAYVERLEQAREEINRIIDEEIRTPKRFVLITNGMHTKLDHYKRGLTRMRRENLYRLFIVAIMTRKRNGK